MESYAENKDVTTSDVSIKISMSPLQDFVKRFGLFTNDRVPDVFQQLRRKHGDFGLFIGDQHEVVFCNLIPLRTSKQAKRIMRLIGDTCARQFSGTRPSVLWLHLQGLDPEPLKEPAKAGGTLAALDHIARYAFKNPARNYLVSLILSSDTETTPERHVWFGQPARGVASTGYVKGFDNPWSRFDAAPVFGPIIDQAVVKD
jgi:hypothetical protein